jgi:hypothetical protein
MTLEISGTVTGMIDAATIGFGLFIVLFKILLRWILKKGAAASVPACVVDLLNGSIVVPFCLMLGSPFAPLFPSTVIAYLKSGSSSMAALAGGIGLFFVLGELGRELKVSV